MLEAAIGPEFGFRYTNAPTPASGTGTGITPGASNAEGSWTQIASAANIAVDIFGVELVVYAGDTSAQIKNHLLDIGIDPAGGTSYTPIISNLICGFSFRLGSARRFYFPIRIPAGASVAARIQGGNATAGVVGLVAVFFGQPSRPELARAGQFSETIGTITGSSGVAFTPGASSAEGAWILLGTTSKDMWWWQIGVQIDDATMTTQTLMIDLAYGDAINKTLIIENMIHEVSSVEAIIHAHALNAYKRVPAGSNIYIRGSTSAGPADSNYNAVAVGVGG